MSRMGEKREKVIDALQSKVIVVRGPREGSIIVFRVDSFEKLMAKAIELNQATPE